MTRTRQVEVTDSDEEEIGADAEVYFEDLTERQQVGGLVCVCCDLLVEEARR